MEVQAACQGADNAEQRLGKSTQTDAKKLLDDRRQGRISVGRRLLIGDCCDDPGGVLIKVDNFNGFFGDAIAVIVALLRLFLDV